MKIKVVTYEEERLEFFTKKMRLAQARYNRLWKKYRDSHIMSDEHERMNNAGRESNFYCDVVELLEKEQQRCVKD